MSNKTFTVAGVSSLNGVYKVRFANDVMRLKVLVKNGHEDVRLVDLGSEYTKTQAVELLSTLDVFQDIDAQLAIQDYLSEHTKLSSRKPKESVVTEEITEEGAELEDENIPF